MIIEDLSQEACIAALRKARVGHLACAHENRPYVVPISFMFDAANGKESYLYGFTTPGQKIEWMRLNPLVCVECDEVTGDDDWTSVIVDGHFYELAYTPQWERQLLHTQDLLRQYSTWWQPEGIAHAASVHRNEAQLFTPIFYRVRIERMTGRRARRE
jgi:nitroimidazol reductase NimA-like FMN-containing flavoprotein (pyridoxamine 5'-phosphate oxidase superfamily)